MSDMWKAYDCLQDEGYNHLTVNHSLNFVDPDSLYHITGSRLRLCYLNERSVHKHIQDLRKDLNYSRSDITVAHICARQNKNSRHYKLY